jgi:hypothetical protein
VPRRVSLEVGGEREDNNRKGTRRQRGANGMRGRKGARVSMGGSWV